MIRINIVPSTNSNGLVPCQLSNHRSIWCISGSDNQAHIVTLLGLAGLVKSTKGSRVTEGVVDLNRYRSIVRVL